MEYFFIFLFSMSVISNPVIGMLIFLADREPCATERTYQFLKAGLFLFMTPLLPLCGIPFSSGLSSPSFLKGISAVWFFGVLISFVKIIRQIHLFKKHVLSDIIPVHDQSLLTLVADIQQEFAITARIPVYYHPSVSSPALVVMKRPFILLGETELTHQELYLILKHELMHLKRKHVLYKRIGLLARTIYWYNPFMSLFVQFFCDYCELDCDRMVLMHETKKRRLAYANLLFKLSSQHSITTF